MFEGFAGVWTPVVDARALGNKPLAVKLAGEAIALFRDGKGGVGALIDRCPHRGVALSLGTVNEDGCLECPFHGWSFEKDGACAFVPLNDVPKDKRARHAAMALPAREIGGLVWVFTGAVAKGEPEVPDALLEKGWARSVYSEIWNAHWTRAMENMLDFPHLPFLHRRTIGGGIRKQLKRDTVVHIDVEPTPTGAVFPVTMEGRAQMDPLEWRRPNGMVLRLLEQKRKVRMHVFCVPVDADHTRMIIVSTRNFLRLRVVSWLSDRYNRVIVKEDRAVVESSQPREVPPPADEVSVASDGPTLHFRRYYFRELRPSATDLVPAARLLARGNASKDAVTSDAA